MKRRKFIKIISGTSAIILVNSCVSSKKNKKEKKDPLFSFIFCNDIHINKKEHAVYFARSIKNWNTFSDKFDFVVIGGDIVEYGLKEEFDLAKIEFDKLKNPFYTVLGNHDVSAQGDKGKVAYRETFGLNRENYIVQHKDIALVFLDLTDAQRSNVEVKKSSVKWLKNELPNIPKDMPVIVFSHFPLHPENPKYPVKNTSYLFNILDERNVLAYFSGHYHGKWRGERDGVSFFSNTCLSQFKNNHDGTKEEGYLFVQVFETGVEANFVAREKKPFKLK